MSACLSPLYAWRTRKRGASGRFGVTMIAREGDRSRPLYLPCGKCVHCVLSARRDWTLRLVHEAACWPMSCMITVTYDDAHLPWAESLHRKDFQDFLKRLRKEVGDVRVYYCGEYGDIGGRPHYHAVLFGYDFPDKSQVGKRGEYAVFRSEKLQRLWGAGRTEVGTVSVAAVAYVAGYVTKKLTGSDSVSELQDKEFVGMSLKPGIGFWWFLRYLDDVYPADRVVVEGRELPPPRRYDEWLRVLRPRLWAAVMVAREARRIEQAKGLLDRGVVQGDETLLAFGGQWRPDAAPSRVEAIREVAMARVSFNKRRLA